VSFEYEYETRSGEEIIATGLVSYDDPVEVGQQVAIGSRNGIVREVTPSLGMRAARVVVQLFHPS